MDFSVSILVFLVDQAGRKLPDDFSFLLAFLFFARQILWFNAPAKPGRGGK
jgi:hypothetical protein